MEYEGTPFLPPPLTFIYYLFMLFKYLSYRNCCCLPRKKSCFRCRFCKCLKSKKCPDYHYDHRVKFKNERYNNDSNLSLFDFSLSMLIFLNF